MSSITPAHTVVLITGANQGLGFECVKKLAAEQPKYHILLCSRNLESGKEAASKITHFAENTTVEPLELDVNSDDSIAKAAKYVEAKYGRVDVLFNNAGIGSTPGATTFRENMKGVIETNAIGAACVTEVFLSLLKKAAFPRLLFMSSGLGSITFTLDPSFQFYGISNKPYLTSKAAMNMIGAQYAVQLGKEGVKVNVVCPGWRATNLNGFNKNAGKAVDGATEACRLIIDTEKNGQHGTFTSTEGQYPW
ncbi:uncharacterized protein Z518_05648 [Rhinocladiella mackenziei CBS 650.93]|uniref:Uncharacterized protein n=1 Tax=Rhinocladiella mackenziei CBS 650.93 TaxID=1442369 RepID=A0A0D2H2W4_9EURO|nr:uncharacterized protein Z518_05648 [Rhinocladiella mackenziei CBS 650.93]KIX04778.1 hypothetical protein Z518_05648 [Rhinocladiella mackenziei CBS 650.93]